MQREQVDPRRVVFLAGVLTFSTNGGASQLRDSDGFSPCFPRFHQRLIPAETRQTLVARWLGIKFFFSFYRDD
ncbi:ABC transporter/ substrate binding / possibly Mndomain protein [Synechococcus sp. NOUM97013]|nr:ABC transporter/ substrate binding / possibly Mndomain protein [Synechococcus sp. NOUM97013]